MTKTPPLETKTSATKPLTPFRKALLLVIPMSFIIGVWWGIAQYRQRLHQAQVYQHSIGLLTVQGIFSPEELRRFEMRNEVSLKVTEIASLEELWLRFESSQGEFDIVTLMNHQVTPALIRNKLATLPFPLAERDQKISADFVRWPGVNSVENTLPLLWGVNGFAVRGIAEKAEQWQDFLSLPKGQLQMLLSPLDWILAITQTDPQADLILADQQGRLRKKIDDLASRSLLSSNSLRAGITQPPPPELNAIQMSHGEFAFLSAEHLKDWKFVLPKTKARLWILSLAVSQSSRKREEVASFLRFMMETETAAGLVRSSQLASTLRSLEEVKVDPMLKPSYLRQIPLDRTHLIKEYEDEMLVGQLIRQTIRN